MGRRKSYELNSQNTILTILFLVVAFIALFWVAQSLFRILAYVAPFLLIITLIINHNIVLNYLKWIWKLLKENTVMGIIASILTVVGFPVVSAFLFARALLHRKVKNMEKEIERRQLGDFAEYEVVDEKPLDLPTLEKTPKTEDTGYEELFD
jgi:hypothetical protein